MNTRRRGTPQEPGWCWDCGGPCATYKGSEHGWRCGECLAVYLDRGWAAWEALSDDTRRRRVSGSLSGGNGSGGPGPEGRREGGGLASGRTAPTATAPPPGEGPTP